MFQLQITLFILLMFGFYFSKKGVITKEVRSSLTDLVIGLFLPCTIIRSFIVTFDDSIMHNIMITLVIGFLYQFIAMFASKLIFNTSDDSIKKIMTYGIIVSNAGFMGQPMAYSFFGSEGFLYASIALIPIRIFMWSAGLALFTVSEPKEVVKRVILHPCLIAVYLGLPLMIFGIELPAFLDNALMYTGNCVTAVSMMVIGAILAEMKTKFFPNKLWIAYYSAIRLLVIPLVMFWILFLFDVEPLIRNVTVFLAAMPAGSTAAMLTSKYGGNEEFATGIVFVTTIFSVITLPAITLLF